MEGTSPSLPRLLKTWLGRLAIAGVAIALAAFLVAWSGLYNVAASSGHWAVAEWLLRFGMSQSVSLRARSVGSPPDLETSDSVRVGAAHFEVNCAFCHGSPGRPVNPTMNKMLPPPPELSVAMRPWKDEELFWIVQNGIKYTGMPGWVAIERDDEIWSVVAFLKRLPTLDKQTYRDVAYGDTRPPAQPGEPATANPSRTLDVSLCARCHGDGDVGPRSALVPQLHGQPKEFLSISLKSYAAGTRRSGIMQPVAADLDDADIERLSLHYAGLSPPSRSLPVRQTGAVERGRQLAIAGDASRGVPSCNSCHDGNALAIYPRLRGQAAAYLAGQLLLWRRGDNAGTEGAAIMAPIARRLDDGDIEAVAAYFAGMPASAIEQEAP